MNPDYQERAVPLPKFRWFSMGVLIAALYFIGSIWLYMRPTKSGENPMDLHVLVISLASYIGIAALWQFIRYRIFKASIAKGSTKNGPQSYLPKALAFPFVVLGKILSALTPTVYTGSRGGQYTVDSKGNKKYKHRR